MLPTQLRAVRRLVSAPATAVNRIFHWTETLRLDAAVPDRAVSVVGALSAFAVYLLSYAGLVGEPLVLLPYQSAASQLRIGGGAILQIPDSVPMQELAIWSVDQGVTSNAVYVNRVTPTHADSDCFSPGYVGLLHGYNLYFEGKAPRVFFKDAATGQVLEGTVDVANSYEHTLAFTYATATVAGNSYYVGASNGCGDGQPQYLPSAVTCLAGCADFFGLAQYGVPQRGRYNYGAHVTVLAAPAAGTDGSASINAALVAASAYVSPAGIRGGVVELQGAWTITSVVLQDYTALRWAAGATTSSPSGNELVSGEPPRALLVAGKKNWGLVNPTHLNLATTATTTPYSNLVGYSTTGGFIVGGTQDLAEGRWIELPANTNLVCVGTHYKQGVAAKATPQRGPLLLDNCPGLLFRGNTVDYAIDCVSMTGCVNTSVGKNTLNWNYDQGNTQPPVAHFFATANSKNATFYGNALNLLTTGTKDLYQQKTGQTGSAYANDGEGFLAESVSVSAAHRFGQVTSATSTTLLGTQVLGANLAGLAGATVLIVAGKGLSQARTITASTASSLTVDTPWDVVPDATSRYVTNPLVWENVTIADNTLTNCKRGILGYNAMMRQVRVQNNRLINSGGIDFSAFSKQEGDYKTCYPQYSLYLDGNTVDSSTDTTNGAAISSHPLLSVASQNFGVLAWNTHIRRNALSASSPDKKLIIDSAFQSGFNVGMSYEPVVNFSNNPAIPISLGAIVENNSARNCHHGIRTCTAGSLTLVKGLRTQNCTAATYDETLPGNATGTANYVELGTTRFTGNAVPGIGATLPAN